MLTSYLRTFLFSIKKKIPTAIKILELVIEDLFVICGLVVIIFATFQWSRIAGLYSIGIVLLLIGLLLSRHPPARR